MSQVIDLTPRGMTTPEGCKRVVDAQKEWDGTAHEVVNQVARMIDSGQLIYRDLHDKYDWDQLVEAISLRAAAQEEFLRAVAGVPPR